MTSTARNTSTFKRLASLVEERATGRATVGAGSAELTLFLLDGHVVAARATDDTLVLIERLAVAGHLREERARQLHAMQTMSATVLGKDMVDPILGLLLEEADHNGFDDILHTRFEENVARFVGHRGRPRFDDGVVPWAYNIQIGHDTGALLDTAVAVWDLSQQVDDEVVLRPGKATPDDEVGRSLVSATQTMPMTAADLVLNLGLPSVVGRAMIARALADGLLVADSATAPELPEDEIEEIEPEVDEELDAFSGAGDRMRGAGSGGTFVTDARNLDRVELTGLDDVSPTSGNRDKAYSPPTLTEDDARDKVGVANAVLTTLAEAIDEAHGPQRGMGALQLLVDGRPRAYIPLFEGIRVSDGGELPYRDLLTNLRRRPESEQRSLLRQGMLDLLDRALDRAADELDEDRFDAVLSKVVGYRQRLGL
ncbi:MAG: hypothetical protein H6733_02330 [Alphaproteobacteria bacterium]|nr:hypothetical protein [Alphaproteobacteria bacterium]